MQEVALEEQQDGLKHVRIWGKRVLRKVPKPPGWNKVTVAGAERTRGREGR